jgi:hypothetical protein
MNWITINIQNCSDLECIWLGIGSEDFVVSTDFLQNTLRIKPLYTISPDGHYALFRLPSCQDIEIISSKSRWGVYHRHPVVGFSIPNIEHYCKTLAESGLTPTSEIISASGWGKFCYMELSEGFYCELIEREPLNGDKPMSNPILGLSSLTLLVNDVHKMASRIAIILGMQQDSIIFEHSSRITFSLLNGTTIEILSCSQMSSQGNGAPSSIIGFYISGSLLTACKLLAKRGVSFIEQNPDFLRQNRCYFIGLNHALYFIEEPANRSQ